MRGFDPLGNVSIWLTSNIKLDYHLSPHVDNLIRTPVINNLLRYLMAQIVNYTP